MTLIKRNRDFQLPELFSDVDPFDGLFNRFFSAPLTRGTRLMRSGPLLGEAFTPLLDIVRGEGDIVIKADLPGVEKEDVDLKVHEDTLTITGSRKIEADGEENGYRYTERGYGEFSRTVRLPGEVDPSNAKASFKNGVLEVRLPIVEEAKPRRIDISVN